MKVLIITEEYGESAMGLVVENTTKGLALFADIDVLTDRYHPKDTVNCSFYIRKKINKTRIQTNSIKYLGVDVLSHWWCFLPPKGIRKKYDLILSFVSVGHFAPLWVGRQIKNKYGGVYFSYFVDAVPAPKPFLKDEKYVARLTKYIKKYCDNVDVIFSSTKEMADYQSKIINRPSIRFEELLNPSKTNELVYYPEKSPNIVFTYTGNIYPPRNPQYLLCAFEKLLRLYPEAQLNIIGNRIINYFSSFVNELPEIVQSHINTLPFQKDLYEKFNESTALIDIGCEVENDIYMSNKINGYFSYCRPIICETSEFSPAARIFKGLNSVIICNHNADSIFEAMKLVTSDCYEVDYTERLQVLEEMSIHGVAQKIIEEYNG